MDKDGGALELYPVESPGTPGVEPTKHLLPAWNSMAFFTVTPGVSFHAVQEVFAEDKPRLSIQGWYHAAEPPKGSEQATLTQLQARQDDDVADFVPFPSAVADVIAAAAAATHADDKGKGVAVDEEEDDDGEPLGPDEADLAYLSRWINPEYLRPENVAQIREKMEEDSSVQMREFLRPEVAAAIRSSTRKEDAACKLGRGQIPERSAGVGGGWRTLGPTHKQRYMAYEGEGVAEVAVKDPKGKGKALEDDNRPAGSLLRELKTELFQSESFGRLATALTGLRPTAHKGEVRRFRPGLDYTVAHHGILTTDPRLDATLCFVDDEGEEASSAWDFGEVGGFECYIAADEEGVAAGAATAEVYKATAEEDEDELLSVSATFNTLSLVHRDEGLMRFVKYVGHLAPSSRWDVAMQYTVEAVEDSDEEEDDEEGEEEEQQQ